MLADDLIHELHGFEDAQDLPRDHLVADFDKGLGSRRRGAVEHADERRRHLLDVRGRFVGGGLGSGRMRGDMRGRCRGRARRAHTQVEVKIAEGDAQAVEPVALHERDELVEHPFIYIHVASPSRVEPVRKFALHAVDRDP